MASNKKATCENDLVRKPARIALVKLLPLEKADFGPQKSLVFTYICSFVGRDTLLMP